MTRIKVSNETFDLTLFVVSSGYDEIDTLKDPILLNKMKKIIDDCK